MGVCERAGFDSEGCVAAPSMYWSLGMGVGVGVFQMGHSQRF